MYPRYAPAHIRQAASSPRKRSGGLPVFLLPPLGLIVAGMLVVFLSGNSLGFRELPLISPLGTARPGVLATFFTPEVQYWGAAIEAWSAQWQIDANLIATVMQIESCGDPQAVSASGARGLFQVMPFHFEAGENPYDPETNAQKGLEYLQLALAASGGDAHRALAGYNGGVALSNAPRVHLAGGDPALRAMGQQPLPGGPAGGV